MAERREFAVELVVTSEHNYTVLARTPEEAISIAEELFESGDIGEVTTSQIETADAASAGDYAEEEDLDLEEEVFES